MQKLQKLRVFRAERTMEKIMERMADLILEEMERKDCNITCFAKLCGIPRNEIGQIVNKQKKDIRLSVIWSICEKSGISLAEVFGIDRSIENYFLTNGRDKYVLKKV